MTTSTQIKAPADVLATTPEQAAAELLALAEFVAEHDEDFPSWILRSGLRLYVSGSIPDADVTSRFEALVEAVQEQGRHASDPDEYAVARDFPPNHVAFTHFEQTLARDVDEALFMLLSPTPPCQTCRRVGPRGSWHPALMPVSVYCASHRPVVVTS